MEANLLEDCIYFLSLACAEQCAVQTHCHLSTSLPSQEMQYSWKMNLLHTAYEIHWKKITSLLQRVTHEIQKSYRLKGLWILKKIVPPQINVPTKISEGFLLHTHAKPPLNLRSFFSKRTGTFIWHRIVLQIACCRAKRQETKIKSWSRNCM